MGMFEILQFSFLATFVSAIVVALILWSGCAGPLDQPNRRSLHAVPVPRSGGLGILAGLSVGGISVLPATTWLLALLMLAIVSLVDDCWPLPAALRLAAHVAAAVLVVWTTDGLISRGVIGGLVVVIAIVWMSNLFNFMDGANGLAGGMALFGFATYALAASHADQADLAVWAGCIAGAAAGFLIFNFDPAKIFMGDVGSVPLGFLAAMLGLEGIVRGIWPLWFPVLVFSPFIVDASVTLLKRTIRGERVWQAHREHFYQRLVQVGWSHRKLSLCGYLVMFLAALSAYMLLAWSASVQWAALSVWSVSYFALLWIGDRYVKRRSRQY